MDPSELPEWEPQALDEAIRRAEDEPARERDNARRRALQLAREQAYHRLAVAIDRPPARRVVQGQLSLWPENNTLFDDAG